MANCTHCDDTGSLSKDLDGFLDCGYCDVADERAELEAWAKAERLLCAPLALWSIYQRGKAAERADL